MKATRVNISKRLRVAMKRGLFHNCSGVIYLEFSSGDGYYYEYRNGRLVHLESKIMK